MPYAFLVAECVSCKSMLTCNPDLVPSIHVNGVKEPLCESCVRKWEKLHKTKFNIPKGAYDPLEVDY